MPKIKPPVLPGKESSRQNCFAFYIDKGGEPACYALDDVYCLKEKKKCPFRKTPEAAARARRNAVRRLAALDACKGV